MTVSTREVINIINDLCEEEDLKVAISGSLKGGAITGLTTVAGGLMFGPVGLAIGGIVGGITSAIYAQGTFKSVVSIIQEMDSEKRQALAQKVLDCLRSFDVSDVLHLTILLSQPHIKQRVIQEIINFVSAFCS